MSLLVVGARRRKKNSGANVSGAGALWRVRGNNFTPARARSRPNFTSRGVNSRCVTDFKATIRKCLKVLVVISLCPEVCIDDLSYTLTFIVRVCPFKI
jgi:hypothetical protein